MPGRTYRPGMALQASSGLRQLGEIPNLPDGGGVDEEGV